MIELLSIHVKAAISSIDAPSDFHSFAISCSRVYDYIESHEIPIESAVDLYVIAEILKSDKTIWANDLRSSWAKKIFTGPEFEYDAESFETGDIGYIYSYPVSFIDEIGFLKGIENAITAGIQSSALDALSVLGTGLPTWDDEFEREETPAIHVIRSAAYRILSSMGKLAEDFEVLPIVFADGTIEDFGQVQELSVFSIGALTSAQEATYPINEFLLRGANPGRLDEWVPEPALIKLSHGFNYECEVEAL